MFLIVRKQGARLLAKKPSLQAKLDKASTWFDKRPYFFLSVYRLVYGMSTVIILMAGLKKISYLRFGIHAAIAIALWVAVIGGLGYFCADLMIDKINQLTDKKWYIIGALIVIGIAVWFFKHRPVNKLCLVPVE